MKKIIITLAAALCCTLTIGAQVLQETTKMSPWLKNKYEQHQTAVKKNHGPLRVQGRPVVSYILALVESNDDAAAIRQKGGVVWQDFGHGICAAFLPTDSLGVLDHSESIMRMEANEGFHLTNDTSAVILGVDKTWEAAGALPQAFTGKDVMAGVMDVGFDFTHPAFRNDDGTSRIKWFWDPLAPDANDDTVGMIYTSTDQLLLARHNVNGESEDHGSHVLGSMAGNGLDGRYVGMAPEADIIGAYYPMGHLSDDFTDHFKEYIKRHIATDMNLDNVILQLDAGSVITLVELYKIFEAADAAGKPCVVNWSFGGDTNFSVETALYEQVFNQLVGPGHIVVAAAGNEGDEMTYIKKTASEPLQQRGYFWTMSEPYYRIQIRCTDDYPDFTLKMKFALIDNPFIIDTRKVKEAAMNGQIYEDSILLPQPDGWDEATMGEYVAEKYPFKMSIRPVRWAGGRLGYVLEIVPSAVYAYAGSTVADFVITDPVEVELLNDCTVPGKIQFSPYSCFNSRGCNTTTIGRPGCLERIITVGAMHHRSAITNVLGEQESSVIVGSEEGHLVSFSSCGPTLEGRIKPDVVAPGHNIVSVLNSFYKVDGDDNATAQEVNPLLAYSTKKYGRNYGMWAMSGTSMATPITAGVIALWLQAKPDLTPEDILGVIERTSHQPEPEFSGTDKNIYYGWGEIDAYAGLLDILNLETAIPELSKHQPAGISIRLQGHTLYFDGLDSDTEVSIYDLSGRPVLRTVTRNGTVALNGLTKGVYAVQLGTKGSTLIRL